MDKKCSICHQIKPLEQFYKRASRPSGRVSACKTCANKLSFEQQRSYYRNKEHLYKKLYTTQRDSSKRRGMPPPNYSREELGIWMEAQPQFTGLFNTWKTSNYLKALRPSCDRYNDYEPYSLSNLRLVTWGDNKSKGNNDRRNGINNKVNIAVEQLDLQNNFIARFHSINEAARQTNCHSGNICNVLSGLTKTTNGFKWRYE